MDKLSALESCFKLFQIFGLQFFSLNSSDKNLIGQHSIRFKLLIISVWITILPGIGAFLFDSYASSIEEKSSFFMIMRSAINISVVVATIVIAISSLVKNLQLKMFFINVQEISDICSHELNYSVNYLDLKRSLHKRMILFISSYVIYIIISIINLINSKITLELLMNVTRIIPVFFLHLFIM